MNMNQTVNVRPMASEPYGEDIPYRKSPRKPTPEEIFQREVYRALTDPKCVEQFNQAVIRKINKAYRKKREQRKAAQIYEKEFNKDFIQPHIMAKSTGHNL